MKYKAKSAKGVQRRVEEDCTVIISTPKTVGVYNMDEYWEF